MLDLKTYNDPMIRNQNAFKHFDKQNKKDQLHKLTIQNAIKSLKELLRLYPAFPLKTDRPQPIALARLLRSLYSK